MAKTKTNPFLAKFEAALEARYRFRLNFAKQLGKDAAVIAANEVLGLGSGRAKQFMEAYTKNLETMARMMVDDGKDDPELDYSIATIDRKIESIVGKENFVPWAERYGEKARG